MSSPKGRVVCITGASRGLGAALARAFAKDGAQLVLGARRLEPLEEVARSLPVAIATQCDVRVESEVENLVAAAVAEFGRLDVMVNNAGTAVFGPFLDAKPEDLDALWATNVRGAFLGSRAALRAMQGGKGGLIVNVASASVRHAAANEGLYAATQWAIAGMSQVLRLEAAAHNVRVTTVIVGPMFTPMWKDQEEVPYAAEVEPERDFLDPELVARAITAVARLSEKAVFPELVVVPPWLGGGPA